MKHYLWDFTFTSVKNGSRRPATLTCVSVKLSAFFILSQIYFLAKFKYYFTFCEKFTFANRSCCIHPSWLQDLHQRKKTISRSSHRHCLAISLLSMTATFSQFFFEEQNTRQECWGIVSSTRPNRWSGSSLRSSAEYWKTTCSQSEKWAGTGNWSAVEKDNMLYQTQERIWILIGNDIACRQSCSLVTCSKSSKTVSTNIMKKVIFWVTGWNRSHCLYAVSCVVARQIVRHQSRDQFGI